MNDNVVFVDRDRMPGFAPRVARLMRRSAARSRPPSNPCLMSGWVDFDLRALIELRKALGANMNEWHAPQPDEVRRMFLLFCAEALEDA